MTIMHIRKFTSIGKRTKLKNVLSILPRIEAGMPHYVLKLVQDVCVT